MILSQAFAEIDEGYVATSLDEAYLDLRPWCARHGATPEEAARRLRERVTELTGGLTCSVGIAPNRMLAKVRALRLVLPFFGRQRGPATSSLTSTALLPSPSPERK
jgi:hypothetical protein